jgi:hypothetical protein
VGDAKALRLTSGRLVQTLKPKGVRALSAPRSAADRSLRQEDIPSFMNDRSDVDAKLGSRGIEACS